MSNDGQFAGPWHSVGSEVFSADGRRVCHTPGSQHFPSQSAEAIANARLIASAPDLLEACKHAELWFTLPRTEIEHDVHTLNTLRAAVAKATGNSAITTPDKT